MKGETKKTQVKQDPNPYDALDGMLQSLQPENGTKNPKNNKKPANKKKTPGKNGAQQQLVIKTLTAVPKDKRPEIGSFVPKSENDALSIV